MTQVLVMPHSIAAYFILCISLACSQRVPKSITEYVNMMPLSQDSVCTSTDEGPVCVHATLQHRQHLRRCSSAESTVQNCTCTFRPHTLVAQGLIHLYLKHKASYTGGAAAQNQECRFATITLANGEARPWPGDFSTPGILTYADLG